MKILLMRQNSYSGREYLTSLMLAGIKVDVLYYGEFPIFNEIEDDRCGGVWNPTSFEKLKIYFNCYYFESINFLFVDSHYLIFLSVLVHHLNNLKGHNHTIQPI